MKMIALIVSLILFSSCELHEQTNIAGEKVKAKVVNLSVIEEISSAIVKNEYSEIERILDSGDFDINIPDKAGELILNKAIKNNRFIIGHLLLKRGADPKTQDGEGLSAIVLSEDGEFAADWSSLFAGENLRGDTSVAQIFSLLEGATPTTEEKFLPLIESYFSLGAPFDGANDGKFTYLMIASSKNLMQIVGLLCEYPEIDPNVTVERGRGRRKQTFSALKLAASEEMKELLRSCGATE